MSFDVLIDQFSSGWGLIVQSPAGDLVVPAFDSSGAALVSVSGRAVTGGLSSGSTSLVGIAPAPTISVAFTGSAVITASGSSTRRCGVTTPGSATITASAAAVNVQGAAYSGSASLTAAAGAEVFGKLIPTDIPDIERVRIVPAMVRYACPLRPMRISVVVELPRDYRGDEEGIRTAIPVRAERTACAQRLARVFVPSRGERVAYAECA